MQLSFSLAIEVFKESLLLLVILDALGADVNTKKSVIIKVSTVFFFTISQEGLFEI